MALNWLFPYPILPRVHHQPTCPYARMAGHATTTQKPSHAPAELTRSQTHLQHQPVLCDPVVHKLPQRHRPAAWPALVRQRHRQRVPRDHHEACRGEHRLRAPAGRRARSAGWENCADARCCKFLRVLVLVVSQLRLRYALCPRELPSPLVTSCNTSRECSGTPAAAARQLHSRDTSDHSTQGGGRRGTSNKSRPETLHSTRRERRSTCKKRIHIMLGGLFSSSTGRDRSQWVAHSRNSLRRLSCVTRGDCSVRCASGSSAKRPNESLRPPCGP